MRGAVVMGTTIPMQLARLGSWRDVRDRSWGYQLTILLLRPPHEVLALSARVKEKMRRIGMAEVSAPLKAGRPCRGPNRLPLLITRHASWRVTERAVVHVDRESSFVQAETC